MLRVRLPVGHLPVPSPARQTGVGDLAAFEQLVLRYQAEAWRVAYRFTGDAAEAEDLAQDAFLRILDAADQSSSRNVSTVRPA